MRRSGPAAESVSAPIIFIGAPRSGTTAIFERFARHPDLAWVSNYSRIAPTWPRINAIRRLFDNGLFTVRGEKRQFKDQSSIRRFLPRPDESYEFWNAYTCPGFDRDFLLEARPDERVARRLQDALERVRRAQGRARITAKLTGPGRVSYLSGALPEARFVHIIRDGLDVVRSLLHVSFWREGGGMDEPWWSGGMTPADLDLWRRSGRDPGVLAAILWRRIVATTRDEAARCLQAEGRYLEVFYEDFRRDPDRSLERIHEFSALEYLRPDRSLVRNREYESEWSSEYVDLLLEAMEPTYSELGYGRR